jgi:hypothetical protein
MIAGLVHGFGQLLGGHMVLDVQKDFQNSQPILETIDAIALEKLDELFLLPFMDGL